MNAVFANRKLEASSLNEIGSRLSHWTYNETKDIYVFSDASGFGVFTTSSEDKIFGS